MSNINTVQYFVKIRCNRKQNYFIFSTIYNINIFYKATIFAYNKSIFQTNGLFFLPKSGYVLELKPIKIQIFSPIQLVR